MKTAMLNNSVYFVAHLNFLSSASTVWMYIMLIWSAVFSSKASACDSRLQQGKPFQCTDEFVHLETHSRCHQLHTL